MRAPKVDWQSSVSGEPLTIRERVSYAVQGFMRRWIFVFAFTIFSVVWWFRPSWFGDTHSYIHWQLWASYMALFIESVVGIGLFGQTKRDAVYLRHIYLLEEKLARALETIDTLNRAILTEVTFDPRRDGRDDD